MDILTNSHKMNFALAFAELNGSEHIFVEHNEAGQIIDVVCFDEAILVDNSSLNRNRIVMWDDEKYNDGEDPCVLLNEDQVDAVFGDQYDRVKVEDYIHLGDRIHIEGMKEIIRLSNLKHILKQVADIPLHIILSQAGNPDNGVWITYDRNTGKMGQYAPDYEVIRKNIQEKNFPANYLSPSEWKYMDIIEARDYHNMRIAQIVCEPEGVLKKPIDIHGVKPRIGYFEMSTSLALDPLVADGYHRLAAHKILNNEIVPVFAAPETLGALKFSQLEDFSFNDRLVALAEITQSPIISHQKERCQILTVKIGDTLFNHKGPVLIAPGYEQSEHPLPEKSSNYEQVRKEMAKALLYYEQAGLIPEDLLQNSCQNHRKGCDISPT